MINIIIQNDMKLFFEIFYKIENFEIKKFCYYII